MSNSAGVMRRRQTAHKAPDSAQPNITKRESTRRQHATGRQQSRRRCGYGESVDSTCVSAAPSRTVRAQLRRTTSPQLRTHVPRRHSWSLCGLAAAAAPDCAADVASLHAAVPEAAAESLTVGRGGTRAGCARARAAARIPCGWRVHKTRGLSAREIKTGEELNWFGLATSFLISFGLSRPDRGRREKALCSDRRRKQKDFVQQTASCTLHARVKQRC